MKKILKVLTVASVGFLLSGCLPGPKKGGEGGNGGSDNSENSSQNNFDGYYDSITDDMKGDELKTALYNIIHPAMSKNNYAYVWKYLQYSDVGHPETTGTTTSTASHNDIIAYYEGKISSKSDMNKEHVWPKSHGGNLIEGDPHMVRPALIASNSDRGNSFYVEGKNSDTNGWDPKAAGLNENYRGDCARIIFYCAVQEPRLKIIDEDFHATSNADPDYMMGKLSDMLKWNLNYAVQQSEKNRNDILNGKMKSYDKEFNLNRNPFIDHPEYACRIWGETNSTTKQICGM